jgi:YidC/Oxa1 family membrane protein insertase
MDNIRLFLWLLLAGMLWLGYTAWMQDYPGVPPPTASTIAPQSATPSPTPASTAPPSIQAPPAAPAPEQPVAIEHGELIHVRTDVLDLLIDSHGADLVQADLLQYPVNKKTPDQLVRLLNDAPADLWVFHSGLRSAVGGSEPNHLATFRTATTEYTLAPGQDELVVSFDWVGDGPISARKTYTFHRGQYAIDLSLSLQPAPGGSWRGAPYVQMVRVHHPVKRSYAAVDSYSFKGPVLFDGERYEKHDVSKLATMPVMQTVKGGWFAAIEHHFLAAAVPPPSDEFRYDASTRGDEFVLSAVGPLLDVSAAAPMNYAFTLFVGPKLQEQLRAVGQKLDLTVDYGRLTLLAHPLFLLLSFVERWVNNWGWAIIIVTMLIKLAFYRLTAASGRSMAKMRRLAPRMKALQERYKEDRAALSQATMELYKREKVNPAAGCLPIVIQMPFFFAFYWVLIESVEMRQAPFMLWINDLSSRDPYFVLPLLMGVAMFFQSRLNPPPPDPMQARVMQIMPVVFSAMFMLFPTGLVLYWLTNTLLSILQQWRINHLVARESAGAD